MKKLLLIILILALTAIPVAADSTSELLQQLEEQEKEQEAKQDALNQKRREQTALKKEIQAAYTELEDKLEANDEAMKGIVSSIQNLELEISDMNLTLEELDVRLSAKQMEINKVGLELQTIREEKDVLHDHASQRIRVMYEYGDTGFLEVLFESKDLMDFFSRLEYVNRLVEADKKMFDSLDSFESEISAREASLEIHEDSLSELVAEAEGQKAKLENKVVSKNLEVENAQRIMAEQRTVQATLSDQQAAAQAQLDAIEREEARVDAELNEILRQKAAEINRIMGLDYNGGMLLWPVPGWYNLSSPFGPRLHPIHKTWKNHNGIDIPAYSGTPIVAAERGEVVISKYSSSYGNYCAISHGNGYLTLYAHCKSLNVKVGDQVNAGQTIATVGTTGWSTGNHLHYGVQKDGVWVDPMQFH